LVAAKGDCVKDGLIPTAGPRLSEPLVRDDAGDYRRLLAKLGSRARWLGSRDPEGAAQEALKRSLENAHSQAAVEYYFCQDLRVGLAPPEWPLDRLFAWLHAVVHYVVREERSRAGYRREVPAGAVESDRLGAAGLRDPADPAPDQLDTLIQKELRGILVDCFPKLEGEYRAVLRMRADGLTYDEIAGRLAVNENTVATWVSRGIRQLAQCVRRRSERFAHLPRGERQ
jgi:RNA polymerase sigma factor (sigma-70 family)